MVKLETVAAGSSEGGRNVGKNCPKSGKKGVKIVSKIFFLDR